MTSEPSFVANGFGGRLSGNSSVIHSALMTDASWSQIDYLLTRKSDIQPDFEPDTPDAPNVRVLLTHSLLISFNRPKTSSKIPATS